MSRALLDAIHAHPEDDRPRLVYADWLTEQGDPRGEFIHLQCAGVRDRADQLLGRHRAQWEPVLRTPGRFAWHFSRGFPFGVHATATELVAASAEIAAAVPTIREATVTRFDAHPELWLATPLLPRLEGVFLHYVQQQPSPTREVVLRVLLDDPRMLGLRRLGISYSYLSELEWETVASSALLPLLESLDMGLGNATNAGVAAVMRTGRRLRTLGVANNRVGTIGCQAIARTPNLLEHLDLSWNRVGVKGARALAESTQLGALRDLDLSHCQIGDEGCEAIARGRLTGLRTLRLRQSRITERGARRLATLPGLAWIDVAENGIEADLSAVDPRFR